MHKVFGKREEVSYRDRPGAYVIPVRDGLLGVVRTGKGYFLLGGGLEPGESDEECIQRECMEETGYQVCVGGMIGSAEAYTEIPETGYFHPIQRYYLGKLLKRTGNSVEEDHRLVWIRFEDLRGNMYVEMQNWAIEEGWKLYGHNRSRE